MSTEMSPTVEKLWLAIKGNEPLAVFSGSVGDAAHQNEEHTYHESYDDNPHDDGYSVHYWGDKHDLQGVSDLASAIDISYASGFVLDHRHYHPKHVEEHFTPEQKKRAKTISSEALMIRYTARMHRWALSGKRDLKIVGMREFAGTLNGTSVFAMDTSHKPYETYGWDDSHLWHNHISINRRLVNKPAILSIARVWAS